jgi:hypothetical protein
VTYSDKAIILAFRYLTKFLLVYFFYFRGTGPWSQTIEEAIEEVFHKKDIFVGGGNVCYYFNQAFLSIWDNGMRDDFLTSINRYPDYEIWVKISLLASTHSLDHRSFTRSSYG